MASYSAYQWIPWQLFCSAVDGTNHTFRSYPAAPFGAKPTPFSASTALNGLYFNTNGQSVSTIIPRINNIDVARPIDIGIEFLLATDALAAGTAQFGLSYVVVNSGPGGTSLDSPTFTSLAVPLFTHTGASGYAGRMYSTMESPIPAYAMTSQSQSLLISVSSVSGVLFTSTQVAFQGLNIYYSSAVTVT